MRQKCPAFIIAFDTTTQALAAEKLFRENGLPGRMIPIPAQVSAGCGLAWKAEPEQKEPLLDAISKAKLGYAACTVVGVFR
ncbi:MAG: DUF3343 domain-containing protein [Pseudoflavonifractor capillosus]|uniref:DUF3343 domain-containing protein n=1 Tax=Pseudoflavonifractor capillosus TaxID=106588 RepID=UPI0023F730A0|nr:DUF3343 domain-containing protein [Pseudoflavonifractor capillosus]MCI5927756.1 DUF3343 domain-containing protein [Pseudoflavonifractor capillosus]MDY4662365.1 DUF3343 domain-containing protein [Pseudoflavonifractor capillosus]